MKRSAGILLPVASLPSKYGIGCFSKSAYDFADWLKGAGQSYWQILPLGPTSYGDSPYQSFSTYAGNPYFISLEDLIEEGVLTEKECEKLETGSEEGTIDYKHLYEERYPVLRKAYERSNISENPDYQQFLSENDWWLSDYALFMACKKLHHGADWLHWPDEYRCPTLEFKAGLFKSMHEDIEYYRFIQFLFFDEWKRIKKYANDHGIRIIGDIPIFVSMDSADVWANQHLFQLDSKGYPTRVAGVPPDYFSATGQLWGNPLYNWEAHEAEHFSWWISRIRAQLHNLDILRVDHFRGFEAFWSIPYGEPTAVNGEWVKAPGHALFSAVRDAFEGNLPIIAEDLGVITPEVEALRDEFGLPGMKVLQFAFDSLDEGSYLPHRYTSPVCVCYTGTHDNDTTRSWYQTLRPECRDKVRRYTHCSNDTHFPLDLIGTALASVAAYAIFPLQDVLCVGAEGRMNTPGIGAGNWSWRYQQSALKGELADELRGMTILYGRY